MSLSPSHLSELSLPFTTSVRFISSAIIILLKYHHLQLLYYLLLQPYQLNMHTILPASPTLSTQYHEDYSTQLSSDNHIKRIIYDSTSPQSPSIIQISKKIKLSTISYNDTIYTDNVDHTSNNSYIC